MGSKLQEYKDTLERSLADKSKPWTKYFDKAEQRTGLNRVYLFVGLVAFTGLYLVFGFGAELICNSIGFVYPAYMSMKALESPQKDDDTKWLTYWVVYACFSVVEYFSDFIVGWFPLYWLIKCIFIIWCYMPTDYNGSLVIYHRIIRPYYMKHHDRIDNIASSDQPTKITSTVTREGTATDRTDRPNNTVRLDRTDHPDRTDSPSPASRTDRPSPASRTDRPSPTSRTDRPGQTDRPDRTDRTDR